MDRILSHQEASAIFDELDRRHAVVRVGGKHCVLTVECERLTGCLVVCVETEEEFKARYVPQYLNTYVGEDLVHVAWFRKWCWERGRVAWGEVVLSKRRMQLPSAAAALFAIAAKEAQP